MNSSTISSPDLQSTATLLLTLSDRLAAAATPLGVLEAALQCVQGPKANAAALMYIGNDDDGAVNNANNQPRWFEIAASQPPDADFASVPVGRRHRVPDFPFTKLWLSSPAQVLLIGDTNQCDGIDAPTRQLCSQMNIQATAILPLNVLGRWVGLIVISWDQPRIFTAIDQRLYNAAAQQCSWRVDQMRSADQARLVAELRQNSQLLGLVLDTAPIWIFAKDHDFRFQLMNKANRTAFHLTPEQVIGKDDFEIGLPPEQILGDPDKDIRGFRADDSDVIIDGKTLVNPHDVVMVDGQERILNTIKLPLIAPDGQIQGLLGIAIDVTQEREREAERERLIKQLVETSQFKDEFFSVMSHELRTPLNAIIGFVAIVLMGNRLNDHDRMMLTRTQANAERLLVLINNILDISRIEAGRLEIVRQPLDVRKVVERLRENLEVLAQRKGIALNVEFDPAVPAVIQTDEDALTKIISNLLANAIKFTDHGTVTLKASIQDEALRIEVRDTGIGIPAHLHQIIFESFRQADSSSTRAYGGSGLGLAIVRRLCSALGGSIRLDSKLGSGSTFTALLPLVQPLPTALPEVETVRDE